MASKDCIPESMFEYISFFSCYEGKIYSIASEGIKVVLNAWPSVKVLSKKKEINSKEMTFFSRNSHVGQMKWDLWDNNTKGSVSWQRQHIKKEDKRQDESIKTKGLPFHYKNKETTDSRSQDHRHTEWSFKKVIAEEFPASSSPCNVLSLVNNILKKRFEHHMQDAISEKRK